MEDAEAHLAEGQFPEGSMGPKVRASCRFLRNGGDVAVITTPALVHASLEGTVSELEGRPGTRIVRVRPVSDRPEDGGELPAGRRPQGPLRGLGRPDVGQPGDDGHRRRGLGGGGHGDAGQPRDAGRPGLRHRRLRRHGQRLFPGRRRRARRRARRRTRKPAQAALGGGGAAARRRRTGSGPASPERPRSMAEAIDALGSGFGGAGEAPNLAIVSCPATTPRSRPTRRCPPGCTSSSSPTTSRSTRRSS